MFLRLMLLLNILLSPPILFAGSGGVSSQSIQYLIGVGAGPTWSTGNKNQTLFLQPDVEKAYIAKSDSASFASVNVFLALQRPLHLDFLRQDAIGQLGLMAAWSGNNKLSGDLWEDADPNFNNFNYEYRVKRAYLGLKGRLIGHAHRFLEPYIDASVGVSANRAYDFTITPKITSEVPPPLFQSHTNTALSYTVGVGLQKSFTRHLNGAIGYEFSSWGKSRLSPAVGQTTNETLALNHIYAHELQISLFYII